MFFNLITKIDLQMPKEKKKRGRREEQKRKRRAEDAENEEAVTFSKRLKSGEGMDEGGGVEIAANADDNQEVYNASSYPGDIPFLGLLDEDEQAYFKRVDTLLELNQFENADERALFLASVYREANGKELKIASSQSCSRLMERLILVSNSIQLKALFQKFSGQFVSSVI